MRLVLTVVLLVLFALFDAHAGEADIVRVEAIKGGSNEYQFKVTVLHKDEGWKHYADKWDILAPDGTVLGTRTLLHPHVDEQPFTRSLSGVKIPEDIKAILLRSHDSVHEYGGKTVTVELP